MCRTQLLCTVLRDAVQPTSSVNQGHINRRVLARIFGTTELSALLLILNDYMRSFGNSIIDDLVIALHSYPALLEGIKGILAEETSMECEYTYKESLIKYDDLISLDGSTKSTVESSRMM